MSRNASPVRPRRSPSFRRDVQGDERSATERETGDDTVPSGWVLPGDDVEDPDVDPDELREFLAGDLLPGEADPVFKERLRQRLWRMVRARYRDRLADEDEG